MALLTELVPTPQVGSVEKKWDKEELLRCRATGTSEKRSVNLEGDAHPIFRNWTTAETELFKELQQPILLASRLLEGAGLEWVSDFVVDDIFDVQYPGREKCQCSRPHCRRTVQKNIVRHHRAAWATPEIKSKWLHEARAELRDSLPECIEWQLDAKMLKEKGWLGYACRHPRDGMSLGKLDEYETVKRFDDVCKKARRKQRKMTLLLMTEYPQKLRDLPKDSEEYLLTAFMAAVTILHELAHAIFWRDFRSLSKTMSEPFYGADLEMELGDSFVAHIFGGWIPVSVKESNAFRELPSFEDGLAWRQHLSWDHHRIRPKYRAHYSIPVDYVARLFQESTWAESPNDGLINVIRPQGLVSRQKDVSLVFENRDLGGQPQYAAAALPDFQPNGDGWSWTHRPGAHFRIPQYDGGLWPDLAQPVAPDGAVREAQPRDTTTAADYGSEVKIVEVTKVSYRNSREIRTIALGSPRVPLSPKSGAARKRTSYQKKLLLHQQQQAQQPGFRRLSKTDLQTHHSLGMGFDGSLVDGVYPGKSEITVDELKKRLSALIGVSLNELEVLFEGC
ncbi:hypothetical protein BX600DRAFT_520062 [Xylariales sp. PMI_506]|nr:hypothetical protein BX600DRAFT_520062 [Xylariales sp. PMI_506]